MRETVTIRSPLSSPGPRPSFPGEENHNRRAPGRNGSGTKCLHTQSPGIRREKQQYHGPRSERFPDLNRRDDIRQEIALAEFRNSLRAANLQVERKELNRQRKRQLERVTRRRPMEQGRKKSDVTLYDSSGHGGGNDRAFKRAKAKKKSPWWELGYNKEGELGMVCEDNSKHPEEWEQDRDRAEGGNEDQGQNRRREPWLSRMRRVTGSSFSQEDRFGNAKRASFVLCDSIQTKQKRRFGHRSLPARLFSQGTREGHGKNKERGKQKAPRGMRAICKQNCDREYHVMRGQLNRAPASHAVTNTRRDGWLGKNRDTPVGHASSQALLLCLSYMCLALCLHSCILLVLFDRVPGRPALISITHATSSGARRIWSPGGPCRERFPRQIGVTCPH